MSAVDEIAKQIGGKAAITDGSKTSLEEIARTTGGQVFRVEAAPGKIVSWVNPIGVDAVPKPALDAIQAIRAQLRSEQEDLARRFDAAVPWSLDIPWASEINVQAHTYKTIDLFPELKTWPLERILHDNPRYVAVSPCGNWRYVKLTAVPGQIFPLQLGQQTGTAVFDGPIAFPSLIHRGPDGAWFLFMNLTPFEAFSLRPGTKLAHGHTIVGGLGLGYHLREIAMKPEVDGITVVEKDAGLLSWLQDRIQRTLVREDGSLFRSITWINGDVFDVLPTLKADVAVVDIAPKYVGGEVELERLRSTCPKIKRIWYWGSNESLHDL